MTPALARLAAASLIALVAGEARAADGETRACISAVQEGQVLHRDGRLRGAREKFIVCARDACPGPVRKDCITWLAEVESSLPSVVFAARLRDGRELRSGRVLFDGEPLQGSLNGRAVTVDPGAHVFRFELDGAKPFTLETVIHEGEKNRMIAPVLEAEGEAPPPAVIPTPAAPSPIPPATPAPAAPAPRTPEPSWPRPIPVAAYAAIGVSVAGFAGFAYFALHGRSELDHLRETCISYCEQSDVDSARKQLLIGDVFLGAGIAAAGVATWLILTRPAVPPNYAVNVQPLQGGAAATLHGRF